MARVPVVDLGDCVECDGCVEVCPEVFRCNEVIGYIEVIECDPYPELEVQDAINFCPTGCICWEEK